MEYSQEFFLSSQPKPSKNILELKEKLESENLGNSNIKQSTTIENLEEFKEKEKFTPFSSNKTFQGSFDYKNIDDDGSDEEDETNFILFGRKTKSYGLSKKESEKQQIQTSSSYEISMISLKLFTEKKQEFSYSFKETFTISRSDPSSTNIKIKNKEVGRNHCQIYLLPKKGFFLQDQGSKNYTFIYLEEGSLILLKPKLEILMGKSLFIIDQIQENRLKINAIFNFTNMSEKKQIEVAVNNKGTYFGKNSHHKNSYLLGKDLDDEIEDEQVLLKYYSTSKQLVMQTLKSEKG